MSIDIASHASTPRPPSGSVSSNGRQVGSTSQPFIIGPHISLTGILQVDGDVWLEGEIQADIHCRKLLIAPQAHVNGVVVADRIEVFGFVEGEIYCNTVVVKDNARVEAELYYRSLELEPGGYFEGRSRRHAEPTKLGPSFV